MSLKILYAAFDVIPSPKGASRHITHFTQTLTTAGHDVTLFTVGLEDMPAEEVYAGARILRSPGGEDNFLRRALGFGDALWEHLRDQAGEYDVVHFRDIWSGAAALEARTRFGYPYRLLFEANGLPSVELKYHYPTLQDSVGAHGRAPLPKTHEASLIERLRAQERTLLRAVDAVVCVSRVAAIYLESTGAPPETISVIPNGVDADCFGPPAEPVTGRPRLVYVGTLAAWQGVDTLIRAMPTILAAFPEAELHLIGPAKSRQQKGLRKLVTRLGLSEDEVRFLGSLPPEVIPDQLRGASVCLAPLAYNDRNVTQGCCPIKVLEYAAAARPIVAADLPVVRELLTEDEARFFQPDDLEDLARQAIYLLSHPTEARAMGQRAARRVCRDFTWERAGRQLLAVYAELSDRACRDGVSMPHTLATDGGRSPAAPPVPVLA